MNTNDTLNAAFKQADGDRLEAKPPRHRPPDNSPPPDPVEQQNKKFRSIAYTALRFGFERGRARDLANARLAEARAQAARVLPGVRLDPVAQNLIIEPPSLSVAEMQALGGVLQAEAQP